MSPQVTVETQRFWNLLKRLRVGTSNANIFNDELNFKMCNRKSIYDKRFSGKNSKRQILNDFKIGNRLSLIQIITIIGGS
jgi:hypothetical protein